MAKRRNSQWMEEATRVKTLAMAMVVASVKVEVAKARVGMVEAPEAVAGRAMAAVMGAGLKAEAAAAEATALVRPEGVEMD